ncbi:MAG TPA: hypothetical protein VHB47_02200 [Thermoanaerobaculia bacterium]|jgi:hypothetical protein|nr:hypothetical protein [Thermoanaerobaculia bacterium]
MSEKKGWATSLKGLFVEPDEARAEAEPEAPSPAEAEAEAAAGEATASPGAAAPPMAAPRRSAGAFPGQSAGAPPGKLDFAAIYTAAGIGPEEQERIAKAAELLHALPEGTEAARHIVEASLKAFGVPVEKILAAGDREIQALDAFAEADAADTRQVLDDSNRKIAQYEQEIQRIRQVMDERVAAQQSVARGCAAGKLELAQVLGFFGHAPATPATPAAAAAPGSPAAPAANHEPGETKRAALPAAHAPKNT